MINKKEGSLNKNKKNYRSNNRIHESDFPSEAAQAWQ